MHVNLCKSIHSMMVFFEQDKQIQKENKMLLFEELTRWRKERALDVVKSEPYRVIRLAQEEMCEAMLALENGDEDMWADGMFDAVIYIINGLEQCGYDAQIVFSEGLREIHSRKGYYDMDAKKFMKNITGMEYTADMKKARK